MFNHQHIPMAQQKGQAVGQIVIILGAEGCQIYSLQWGQYSPHDNLFVSAKL